MATIETLSDASLATRLSSESAPILVLFSARWCGPCKPMKPALEEIAAGLSERLVLASIDIDESPESAVKYGIRGVPTMLLFRAGEVVSRKVGAGGREALKTWVCTNV